MLLYTNNKKAVLQLYRPEQKITIVKLLFGIPGAQAPAGIFSFLPAGEEQVEWDKFLSQQ